MRKKLSVDTSKPYIIRKRPDYWAWGIMAIISFKHENSPIVHVFFYFLIIRFQPKFFTDIGQESTVSHDVFFFVQFVGIQIYDERF